MASNEQTSNIRVFQRRKYINIGIIFFGIIFIYLVITIFRYLTTPRITPYEVRQGAILKDTAYTGIALRDETVVYADASGYINYYAQNNSKVHCGSNIYTLSAQKLAFPSDTPKEEVTLSNEQKKSLSLKMQVFSENFQESLFSETYALKNNMEDTLQNLTSRSRIDLLNETLNSDAAGAMTLYPTSDDGIVVYSVDGMEALNADSVNPAHLSKEYYKKTEFADNVQVDAGAPVYKLVTSENWKLAIQLSEDTAKFLQGKQYVRVRFTKDNQILWADLELKPAAGKTLALLGFDNSMIRYVNDRYLDVELILEDQSGLKIPKSAKTTKEFYAVPKSYITQGGNSLSQGVMKKTQDKSGKEITEFLPVNVYYEEEEIVYLDPNVFHDGDVLVKPESTELFTVKEKKPLDGVYNINKGYALFKQIQILCESEEYYIIEEGSSYGLSNYDRIALDSNKIKENDIVF